MYSPDKHTFMLLRGGYMDYKKSLVQLIEAVDDDALIVLLYNFVVSIQKRMSQS